MAGSFLRLRRLAGGAAFACLLIIAVLSLLPGDEMVRTGAPKTFEHFIAYCGTAVFCAFAFGRDWTARAVVVALLALLAAMMEFGQYFSPGRTPFVSDFIGGSLGGIVGMLVGTALMSLLGRWKPATSLR